MNSIKKCQCYASAFHLFPSTSLWLEKTDGAILPPAGLGPTYYPQFSHERGNWASPHLNRFPSLWFFCHWCQPRWIIKGNLWQMKCNVFEAVLFLTQISFTLPTEGRSTVVRIKATITLHQMPLHYSNTGFFLVFFVNFFCHLFLILIYLIQF